MIRPARPTLAEVPLADLSLVWADAIPHFASPHSRCFSNLSSTNRTKQNLIVHFFRDLTDKLKNCVTKQCSTAKNARFC
jgi:hypothetical protein